MRTILITGGTGKFGKVLIKYFLELGDVVVFTSRSREHIETILQYHEQYQGKIHGIEVDLTAEKGPEELLNNILSQGINISCLINNVRDLSYLKIEEDGLVARKNFLGEFLLDVIVPYEITTKLAYHAESTLRRVVNISSQYSLVAANPILYTNHEQQSPIQYGVAKAALNHLTKELAVRLASRDIQVNCVAFGGVEGRVDDAFLKRYASLVPNRRMLQESEIPGSIDYFLSDKCSGTTGHIMAVDGGWTLW